MCILGVLRPSCCVNTGQRPPPRLCVIRRSRVPAVPVRLDSRVRWWSARADDPTQAIELKGSLRAPIIDLTTQLHPPLPGATTKHPEQDIPMALRVHVPWG